MNYGDWQNDVYLRGLSGEPPAFPVDWGELEAQAAAKVEPGPQGYVWGGAGSGDTMRANLEAFRRWRIVPRCCATSPSATSASTLLGHGPPAPVMLAPIGVQSILHPDGELAVARARPRASGVPWSSAPRRPPAGGRRRGAGRRPALVPALLAEGPGPGAPAGRAAPSRRATGARRDARHLPAGLAPARHAAGLLPFIQRRGHRATTSSDPVFRAPARRTRRRTTRGAAIGSSSPWSRTRP